MIKKLKHCPLKKFKGVDSRKLAEGEEIAAMITYFKKGDKLPIHDHNNEQVGYVVDGKLKIISGDEEFIVQKGDSYAFPKKINHGFIALEDSETLDMFRV